MSRTATKRRFSRATVRAELERRVAVALTSFRERGGERALSNGDVRAAEAYGRWQALREVVADMTFGRL